MIGARLHWLTVDAGAFPALATPTKSVAKARGIGLVLDWYLAQSLRLAVSFDRTAFDGGAGTGTAIADRKTEKVLIGRLQIAY